MGYHCKEMLTGFLMIPIIASVKHTIFREIELIKLVSKLFLRSVELHKQEDNQNKWSVFNIWTVQYYCKSE